MPLAGALSSLTRRDAARMRYGFGSSPCSPDRLVCWRHPHSSLKRTVPGTAGADTVMQHTAVAQSSSKCERSWRGARAESQQEQQQELDEQGEGEGQTSGATLQSQPCPVHPSPNPVNHADTGDEWANGGSIDDTLMVRGGASLRVCHVLWPLF